MRLQFLLNILDLAFVYSSQITQELFDYYKNSVFNSGYFTFLPLTFI